MTFALYKSCNFNQNIRVAFILNLFAEGFGEGKKKYNLQ